MKIQLSSDQINIVQNILAGLDVIIFGSRIKGTAKTFSDLDVCIKNKLSPSNYELLKEKFEESDLPFKVDIAEYERLDDFFKNIIKKEGINLKDISC